MYTLPNGKKAVLVGGIPSGAKSASFKLTNSTDTGAVLQRQPAPTATLPPPTSEPPLVQPQPTTTQPATGGGGGGGGTTTPPPVTQPAPATPAGGPAAAPAPQAAAPAPAPRTALPLPAPFQPADLSTALTPPPLPTVQQATAPRDPNIGDFANEWQQGQPDTYGWLRRNVISRSAG